MIHDLTVNNISYDWKDIKVHFGSLYLDPVGVSSISYNTVQDHQLVYSRQGLPVARQWGKYECSASITLDYYEMLKLREYANLMNYLPRDIRIEYNKGDDNFIDTLYGCRIDFPDELSAEQNDMNLEVTINLNPVWIKYGKKNRVRTTQVRIESAQHR